MQNRSCQQEAGVAQHLAALRRHDVTGVLLQAVAEGVVGRDEIPAVESFGDQRLTGAVGDGVGVVGPMNDIRTARVVGDAHRPGRAERDDLVVLLGDFEYRQCRGRRGDVKNGIQPVLLEPLAGDRGCNVGLVLVIGGQHLNGLAKNFSAELLDGHLSRGDRAFSRDIRIDTGHILDQPDADDIVADPDFLSHCDCRQCCRNQCCEADTRHSSGIFHSRPPSSIIRHRHERVSPMQYFPTP
jgi:hypothetical protein